MVPDSSIQDFYQPSLLLILHPLPLFWNLTVLALILLVQIRLRLLRCLPLRLLYSSLIPRSKGILFSPYWKPRGSSLSSIASARPSSVPQTTSFTNDTTTLVGVAFGFLDVYGRCCMPWISLTTFTNWRVMGWIESRLR